MHVNPRMHLLRLLASSLSFPLNENRPLLVLSLVSWLWLGEAKNSWPNLVMSKSFCFSPNPQLQASLVTALLKKLQSAENSVVGEYVQLLHALEQCKLDEETKKGLSEAILLRASGGSGESGHKLVKVPQVLKNPVAYLTKGEIVSLMQGDIKDVPMVIARRLRLVGLTSLKESTKKAAVTLQVQAHLWQNLPQPTPDRIYSMAGDFQDLFLSLSYQAAVAPFKTYPDDPKDLGPAWISKAYGGDQPSCASLPQLTVLGKSCPIRTTSRLLKSGSGHMSSSMNMLGMECKQKTWLELMKEKVAEAEEEAKAKQTMLGLLPGTHALERRGQEAAAVGDCRDRDTDYFRCFASPSHDCYPGQLD